MVLGTTEGLSAALYFVGWCRDQIFRIASTSPDDGTARWVSDNADEIFAGIPNSQEMSNLSRDTEPEGGFKPSVKPMSGGWDAQAGPLQLQSEYVTQHLSQKAGGPFVSKNTWTDTGILGVIARAAHLAAAGILKKSAIPRALPFVPAGQEANAIAFVHDAATRIRKAVPSLSSLVVPENGPFGVPFFLEDIGP